ncbi:MAG: CarboxypepD reg-like domain, partial [Bacteroidota bacterium]
MQPLHSRFFKSLRKQLSNWSTRLLLTIVGFATHPFSTAKVVVTSTGSDTSTSRPVNQVYGILWDEETHEPVAYANIFYKGTALGIYTDFEGQFNLGYRPWPSDTVEIVYMGYETVTIALDTVKTLPLQVYFKRKIERTEGAS